MHSPTVPLPHFDDGSALASWKGGQRRQYLFPYMNAKTYHVGSFPFMAIGIEAEGSMPQ